MLILNPRTVTFGPDTWHDVEAVAIDRRTTREAVEWTDRGPHPTLADAPEQRTTLRITQQLARDDPQAPTPGPPTPGDHDLLTLHVAPSRADTPRTRVTATCVVLDVTHDLSLKRGPTRTITLIALSPDGAADPITTTPADGID